MLRHFLLLAVHPFLSTTPTAAPKGYISRITHLRENGFYARTREGREPAGVLGGQDGAHSWGG